VRTRRETDVVGVLLEAHLAQPAELLAQASKMIRRIILIAPDCLAEALVLLRGGRGHEIEVGEHACDESKL